MSRDSLDSLEFSSPLAEALQADNAVFTAADSGAGVHVLYSMADKALDAWDRVETIESLTDLFRIATLGFVFGRPQRAQEIMNRHAGVDKIRELFSSDDEGAGDAGRMFRSILGLIVVAMAVSPQEAEGLSMRLVCELTSNSEMDAQERFRAERLEQAANASVDVVGLTMLSLTTGHLHITPPIVTTVFMALSDCYGELVGTGWEEANMLTLRCAQTCVVILHAVADSGGNDEGGDGPDA